MLPQSAQADVYSQTLSSDVFATFVGNGIVQTLGNGFDGAPSSLSLRLKDDSGASTHYYVRLACYTDNTYTTLTACDGSGTADVDSPAVIRSSQIPRINSSDSLYTFTQWGFATSSPAGFGSACDFGAGGILCETDSSYLNIDSSVYVAINHFANTNWDLRGALSGDPYTPGTCNVYTSGCTSDSDIYFVYSDTAGAVCSNDSCIYSHVPTSSSVVATSSTFSLAVTGNVGSSDTSGAYLSIRVYNNAGFSSNNLVGPIFAINGFQTGWYENVFENSLAPGGFTFSTTTDLQQVGQYTMVVQIRKLNFFFFDTLVVEKRVPFLVATSTNFDLAQDQLADEISDIASSIGYVADTCSFNWTTTFSIIGCVKYLIIPSPLQIQNTITLARDDILTRFPWGYFTILYDMLTDDTASSTPPVFAMTLQPGIGGAGKTLSFSPFELLAEQLDFIDSRTVASIDGSPLDFILYYWDLIMYVLFAFWVLREFTNFKNHQKHHV